MDRVTVYPGAIPLETDILNTNRNTLTAIAELCQDIFGTSTVFTGLGCVPAIPAALTVTINPGRVYLCKTAILLPTLRWPLTR